MTETPLRLRRLVAPPSGHALLLSFTTGLSVGVVPGLADLAEAVGTLAETGHLTGVVVHAGALPHLFRRLPGLPCGAVVDLFGGTLVSPRPDRSELICTLEQAVRAGADAVLATVSLGGPDEAHRLRLCGEISRDCAAWGMPLVVRVLTVQTDPRRHYSATLSGLGGRLAYEVGADAVVVNYSGEPNTFAEALRGVDIPVLIGGAPRLETDEALLDSLAQAVRAGARGLALPASMFWQDGRPTPALERAAALLRG
jgi:DhnA family fructose-bisphosphate aldolase class Ia